MGDTSPISTTVVQDKDDCSCGIAAILESRSQSRAGVMGPAQVLHSGHAVQASININPHQTALPARHSKSLDQLRIAGHFATMPTRSCTQHVDRKKKVDDVEHNGCTDGKYPTTSGGRRRLPYASRSTVDLALRCESTPTAERSSSTISGPTASRSGERIRSPRKHYEFHHAQQHHQHQHHLSAQQQQKVPPPRPLSEPQQSNTSAHPKHHHCRSSDESERRRVTHRADNTDGTGCTQFPRSNSTQIFPPNRQELDIIFHHSTLILSRNKERPMTPNYRSDPERRHRQHELVSGRAGNHRSNLDSTRTFPRHNQTSRVNKCSNSKEDYTCAKNSSISGRYKLSGSREPIVTSSSTDSESLPNGAVVGHVPAGAGAATCKRLHTSASVPHHLARGADGLRHVRSASSVLDEMFPLAATASESLPNLAQPEQRAAILSLSTSGSTSSLTSERSGWVSSHSVSEISSPEPLHTSASGTTVMPLINGEQLRTKLYELVAGQQAKELRALQHPSKHKQHPPSLSGYGRTGGNVTDVRNCRDGEDNVNKMTLLDDGKRFVSEMYGYGTRGHSEDMRNNGLIKVQLEHPYIKKEIPHVAISSPDVKEQVGGGYEEVRLPPPKQFRDVPLPPEPFRDPSPGPSPAIDNLLYHVYESIQDDIKKSQSNTDLANKIEGNSIIIQFHS